MPSSATLGRFTNTAIALELEFPAADGAIRHARLLLDELLVAPGFQQQLDALALFRAVGLAHHASSLLVPSDVRAVHL